MRRLTAGLCVSLMMVFGCVAYAAAPRKSVPLVVEGDTVTVVRKLPFAVKAKEGATLYDWTFPDNVKATAEEHVLTVTSCPKGTFKVRVRSLTIDFDNKKVIKDFGEIEVNYGGVPPGPDPDPDPAPDDPLVKSLKDAYTKETSPDKAKHMEALAALFRQAAKMDLSSVKTVGELYQKLTAASRALLPVDALKQVRVVTGAELKKVLTDSTDADLTAEARQRVLSLFGRLGDALTEAAK